VPRQTADLIALILAVVVAIIVIATAAALLWAELADPHVNTSAAADFVSRVVGVLVGALVGYMAGRQVSPPTK
jgi:uncharacterized protein YacL